MLANKKKVAVLLFKKNVIFPFLSIILCLFALITERVIGQQLQRMILSFSTLFILLYTLVTR